MPYPSQGDGRTYQVFDITPDDPAAIVNAGKLYCKRVSSIEELFWLRSDGSVEQITPNPADLVSSVFGRVGDVVAQNGDYTSSLITNLSGVTGALVTDALNTLDGDIAATDATVAALAGTVAALTSTNISNASGVAGLTVTAALNTLLATIGAITSSGVTNASSVTGTSVTDALNTLLTYIANLTSSGVANISSVSGATVTAALNALLTSINTNTTDISALATLGISLYSGAGPHTPALTDKNKLVQVSHGSACQLLAPNDTTRAFAVGSVIPYAQWGAGTLTVTADSGVSLLSKGGLVSTSGQYAACAMTKVAANTWWLTGDRA